MKKDLQILKEVFTVKNMIYGILFNILWISMMYGILDFFLYLRYDLELI